MIGYKCPVLMGALMKRNRLRLVYCINPIKCPGGGGYTSIIKSLKCSKQLTTAEIKNNNKQLL